MKKWLEKLSKFKIYAFLLLAYPPLLAKVVGLTHLCLASVERFSFVKSNLFLAIHCITKEVGLSPPLLFAIVERLVD